MITDDTIVYGAPGGKDYVGHFARRQLEGWFRWPAKADGWREHKACPMPTEAEGYIELPAKNASLALRFSGVTGAE